MPSSGEGDAGLRWVVFLGPAPLAQDSSYRRFAAAWQAQGLERVCPDLRLRHQWAPETSVEKALISVHTALTARPWLIVSTNAVNALAAVQAAPEKPQVFASYPDPVAVGIVGTAMPRARPITGVSLFDELHMRRLQILRAAFPQVKRIGVFIDHYWRVPPALTAQSPAIEFIVADSAEELVPQLRSARARGYDAYYVPPTYIADLAQTEILAFLKDLKKPAIHSSEEEVARGGLMAYTQDTSFVFPAMAGLVGRICQGEFAGALPIERPHRYVLTVRASYDLAGVKMAPEVVARADRIEP